MTELKTDVLKASVLAVIAASLLGATTYVLSPKIETEPRLAATIDTYTGKGGHGLGIVSSSYFYNENVSIFANIRDETNKPVANSLVTFEIHGPTSSNITLTQTTTTNSSGVAVATVTAPYLIDETESVLGIWTATATTEIAGTQVIDSIVFEVKTPPNPLVDVYTDRGGKGLNIPSQPYIRDEGVNLYAEVNNGTGPVADSLVTFTAYGPTSETVFLAFSQSNSSGTAIEFFRIPLIEESLGTWRVIATVRINDQVFIDALTFECNP